MINLAPAEGKSEPVDDGWQAEAEAQASALAERAGIDMLDDHGQFLADLEQTLIDFAQWAIASQRDQAAARLVHDATRIDAETVVDSDSVLQVYTACEWAELNQDGQVWVQAIVDETTRRVAADLQRETGPRRETALQAALKAGFDRRHENRSVAI